MVWLKFSCLIRTFWTGKAVAIAEVPEAFGGKFLSRGGFSTLKDTRFFLVAWAGGIETYDGRDVWDRFGLGGQMPLPFRPEGVTLWSRFAFR